MNLLRLVGDESAAIDAVLQSPRFVRDVSSGKPRLTGHGRKFPVEILTDDEVRKLMAACSRRAVTGIRNKALIALLYRSGLRCSEGLALFPKDIDLDAGTVRVLHGKGDQARTVGIDEGAAALIREWLDKRAGIIGDQQARVFCTLTGRPVQSSYVRQMMPRMARRAGIDKRVHAHGLRHTHACQLAEESVPMNVIQRQLGHSNAATTSRYLDHIAPIKVIEAIKSRTWKP